jgi:hypothetical protein
MLHTALLGLTTALLLLQFTRPPKIDLVPYAALAADADVLLMSLLGS